MVIPAVCGGYPSEKDQDGFPIENDGNDRDGDGLPINIVRNEEEKKIPVGAEITEGGFVLNIQHVHHSSDIVWEVKSKFLQPKITSALPLRELADP